MNPNNRRRVILDGKPPTLIVPPAEDGIKTERKRESTKGEGTQQTEKSTPMRSNMVTPQDLSKRRIQFTPKALKKMSTNVSDASEAGSKKSEQEEGLNEIGKAVMGTAKLRKGNEEQRRSFHYKLNILNLVSSFLGLLGLILQMVEVRLFYLVSSVLLPCSTKREI